MEYYGFVVMNYLNFGGDKGSWVYNRMIILRCDNVIPEEKQDKNLVEHLLEEKEYIVSLAIRGLKQVINNGYKYSIPKSCKMLKEEYEIENHSFLAFYKECIVQRKTYGKIEDKCTTAKLYRVYEAWCKENNNGYKETKKEVKKILKEKGEDEIKKTKGGNTYYKAITLTEEAKNDYQSVYNPNDSNDNNYEFEENTCEDSNYDDDFGNNCMYDFSIEFSDKDLEEINKLLDN